MRIASEYPTQLYEGKGEYGKPHGVVSVDPNNPATAKLSVQNSFDIKDDLKGRGYSYNGDRKSWDTSGTNDKIKTEVDYINTKGGSSNISDGQSLGVTAIVGKYGADAKNLAGKVPARDLFDAIDNHAASLGLQPKLQTIGKDATNDERIFYARRDIDFER